MSRDGTTGYPWYALKVKVRHEKNVERLLSTKGHPSFVPIYRAARRWGNRDRSVDLPLFSGYVFSRFNVSDRLPILVTPGVVSAVGFGDGPLPVDEQEMSALIKLMETRTECGPHPYVRTGERARVVAGPMCGVEGILVGSRQRSRLILSVELLQRSVAVEVDETWVEPILQTGGPVATSTTSGWDRKHFFQPCG